MVFESVAAAEEALVAVRKLGAEKEVSVRDAAVVARTQRGRIELEQTRSVAAGEGLVGGGAAGLVAGVLLGVPVGGALIGLVGGAVLGMRDTGIPDRRLRKVGEDLRPVGRACAFSSTRGSARVRDALGRYGTVFDVALSPDAAP